MTERNNIKAVALLWIVGAAFSAPTLAIMHKEGPTPRASMCCWYPPATGAASTLTQGVTIYQMTDKGLALQATLQGTKYWKNDELN